MTKHITQYAECLTFVFFSRGHLSWFDSYQSSISSCFFFNKQCSDTSAGHGAWAMRKHSGTSNFVFHSGSVDLCRQRDQTWNQNWYLLLLPLPVLRSILGGSQTMDHKPKGICFFSISLLGGAEVTSKHGGSFYLLAPLPESSTS